MAGDDHRARWRVLADAHRDARRTGARRRAGDRAATARRVVRDVRRAQRGRGVRVGWIGGGRAAGRRARWRPERRRRDRAARGWAHRDAERDRKRVGVGISGFGASTGQPLLLRGPIVGDGRFTGNDPSIADALVAPLRAGDQLIGVVSVKRRGSAPPYESADLDSLSAIGADIAATLSFVDAIARAEEDRKQAIALYELSRLGSLGGEPQQELDTAVAMLADVMHHDVVGLWVVTPEGLV